MLKFIAILISAIAIGTLMAPSAYAGASASAPTKYVHSSQQVMSVHMVRQTKRMDTPVTDFSAQARTAPFHR